MKINASKSVTTMIKRGFDIQTDYNLGQNIWNKIEKSSKVGQGKKSLMSTFVCFLTAIVKV